MSDLRYDDEPLPVYGSRFEPQGWGYAYSGLRCGCAEDRSCVRCDGTADDWREVETGRRWTPDKETTPPCMKSGWKPANHAEEASA